MELPHPLQMNIQLRKLHLLIQQFMILQLRHTSFITQSLKEIHSGRETGLIDTGPLLKVRNRAKIRNQYNQVPHLTQDTNRKVTNSQLDISNEGQEVSPFPAGDHKATKEKTDAHKSIANTRQKYHKSDVPCGLKIRSFR